MKSCGVLVNKGELRNNFKLTFKKDQEEFFLILHQSQEKIFNNLKFGVKYYFNWTKGAKYTFINPYSIEPAKEKKTRTQETKTYFLKDLADKLKLRETTVDYLETEISKLEAEMTDADFQKKVKSMVQLLFIKHQELGKRSLFSLSEKQKQEKELLDDLKTLFLADFYYSD